MAFEKSQLRKWLAQWQTLIDENPALDAGDDVRELWLVESVHGERYYLKRFGPWRNLPVLSEYRMIVHLLEEGVRVPAFQLTDDGAVTAGPAEDSFVLMRAFEHDPIPAAEIPRFESEVGSATAQLHRAMSRYPQPLGSYTEDIERGITDGLRLSDDLLRITTRASWTGFSRVGCSRITRRSSRIHCKRFSGS
jgi:hypothetical protein